MARIVVGADLSAGSWAAIRLVDGRFDAGIVLSCLEDVATIFGADASVIAVDIPLSYALPGFKGRVCEREGRKLLGPRRSSMFDTCPEGGYRLLGTLDGYTSLQDPGPHPVNPVSMRIHGIPIDHLIGQRPDARKIRRLIDGCKYVIAHNAEFDHRFLSKDVPEIDQRIWLCSYRGIPWTELGFATSKLRDLSVALGLPRPEHRAPGDVVSLYRLLDMEGRT